jgi:hypothetical protein
METNQTERQTATPEQQPTEAEQKRDQLQRQQLEAQAEGDTGAELKALAKEFIADHAQFPRDVVEDNRDPQRRVNEEQGTTTQPGAEPAEER